VHVVVQGECLSSIARSYGFEDWTVLYNLPENAELKQLRPNPNALRPGDRVAIPERIPFQMEGAIGSWHTIRVKREKPHLRVRLRGIDGQPLANRKYVFEFDDTKREGSTDGDGLLDELVPASLNSALVTVEITDDDPPQVAQWKLQVGSLNPADDVTGAQSRLRNLSLYTGPIDGRRSDAFRLALRSFQTQNELEVNGLLDDATAKKLGELHDEDA
jgi:hypothetical protein